MTDIKATFPRRDLLVASAAAGLALALDSRSARAAAAMAPASSTIRPFRANIHQMAINDMRRRAIATRWPEKETVADRSQGAELARLQELVHYWGTGYDWRKAEAKLNAFPQFMTSIDGLDIHFIHVRSGQANAMPLVMTHGWPGSVFELLRSIEPLTNPTAHGGRPEDAFDLVLPSLPGYGFSAKPTGPGWDPDHIARAWTELMKRLGYTHYCAQGGDWGAVVTTAMARQAPAGLLGVHINNLAAAIPAEVAQVLPVGGPPPAGLSARERAAFDATVASIKAGRLTYSTMMTVGPQTIGYGTTDSPAGLAAWLLGHPGFARWNYGADADRLPTRDDVLDDISLYWLTNTAASSARLYFENHGRSPTLAAAQRTSEISLPVAVSVFMEDGYRPPESWLRRAFRNLSYYHEVEKGGHFAAWEQPALFGAELRAAFKPLRRNLPA